MNNYFNYFTEIERYFQTRRDTFTLLSTLDWVLIENWQQQGIPLEVVLKGIERAFSRSRNPKRINSLAYCAKAVQEVTGEQKVLRTATPDVPEFAAEEVAAYLEERSVAIAKISVEFPELASKFQSIAESVCSQDVSDLRRLEQSLSALEEKLVSLLQVAADDATMIEVKKDVDASLNPYRQSMTVEQLAMLEQQLRKRKLMERLQAPRLSLFFL